MENQNIKSRLEEIRIEIYQNIKSRLEEIRIEIRAERISLGEIAELKLLSKHIDKNDVELLQWAGVDEFEEDEF